MRPPIEEPPVNPFFDEEERVIRPNKSQLKRDAVSLLNLGKKLVALDTPKLNKLQMPNELRQCLMEGKNIHQNGARKRHFKFIGKILREMDTDLLEKTINDMEFGTAKANAQFRMIERWRDRLLNVEDVHALDAWLEQYPQTDISHIRQLMRNAQKELKQQKPPKSMRILFQALRDTVQQARASNNL
ncbi:MAG: ribosome biogenesis factor YjgA [Mariprofundaceae bacterium]|nr:ribosome biogenesis factor YjgA [Mariprofundaceae bacterium]